eukprot:2046140-Rhodomonas_salina.1
MWASPSVSRKEPEELLREFLTVTQIKVGQLRTDNEFTTSSTFKVFFKKLSINMCPSVAYTHTMQAREEGAVRICKEHVLCLLMASNAPPRFWPFALLHFCRVYNYWPGCKTLPPWEKMEGSGFTFNLERDLHPRGCYMVAKLPKEHPLVQVDSTHVDRGLEGVFLALQSAPNLLKAVE